MSRLLPCLLLLVVTTATVAGDARVQVDLPPMMRDHMLGNMRDHLEVIDTCSANSPPARTTRPPSWPRRAWA